MLNSIMLGYVQYGDVGVLEGYMNIYTFRWRGASNFQYVFSSVYY